MNGIVGLLERRGRALKRGALDSMMDVLALRPHDGLRRERMGCVALGAAWREVSSGDTRCATPALSTDGRIAVVMDGRFYYRHELDRALWGDRVALEGDAGRRPCGDAARVMQAWRSGHRDGVRHLQGEYAFALWDEGDHTLFLARDPLGKRPLYYAVGATHIAFASEIAAVLAAQVVPRAPDEEAVAIRLCGGVTRNDDTLYRGVLRLRPGHALMVRDGTVRVWRWYEYPFGRRVRFARDQDYAARFLDVFEAAVRERSDTIGPLAVDISGGLDSSSVAAVSAGLHYRGLLQTPEVRAYTMMFPGWRCDERSYARDVALWRGLSHTEALPFGQHWARVVAQVRRYGDLPDLPNGAMSLTLRRRMLADGARVELGGVGSDEWLSGTSFALGDALRAGRWREAMRLARRDAGSVGDVLSRLARRGMWPHVPYGARLWRYDLRSRRRGAHASWISDAFAARVGLHALMGKPLARLPEASLAQSAIVTTAEAGWTTYAYEMEARAAGELGMEKRSPFTDQRLVELALAVPHEQLAGSGKWMLRQAMRGFLPTSVRTRRIKASFEQVYAEPVADLARHLDGTPWEMVRRGWVEQGSVNMCLARAKELHWRSIPEDMHDVHDVWSLLAMEVWAREAF